MVNQSLLVNTTTGDLSLTEKINIVGMIAPFASKSVPIGWLVCDGATYSQSTYPDLYTAIGTTFGATNATQDFKVPDLRGMYIRGFDSANGRQIGHIQKSAIKTHTHGINEVPHTHTYTKITPYQVDRELAYNGKCNDKACNNESVFTNVTSDNTNNVTSNAQMTDMVIGTTRVSSANPSNPNPLIDSNASNPRTIYYLYCIKY